MLRTIVCVMLFGVATAAAQPLPAPVQAPREREGLMFGGGAQIGSLVADCDECRDTFEAFGLDVHVGWMLSPRFAIVVDSWAMLHHEDFLTVYQHVGTLNARVWATPRLWLQAGLGVATAGYEWDGIFVMREDRTARSPGVMAGFGYEMSVRDKFVIELQARFGTGFYEDDPIDGYVAKGHSAGIGIGVQWY